MTMIEIFEKYYNELTQDERDTITTTDLHTSEALQFENLADFKEYAKELYKMEG